MPIASRLTSTGSLLVNGSFDENTSISPSVFRTTATTVYASSIDEISLSAGAISFNGTNYLSVPYTSLFDMGSGDFTVEFWMYSSGITGQGIMAFPHNAGNYATILFFGATSTNITFYSSSAGTSWDVAGGTSIGNITLNSWNHIAASKSGSSIRLFLNGALINTVTFVGTYSGTYDRVWIGDTSGNSNYNGLLSDLRVVKGTAVYTAAFTPPSSTLPEISGTSLLLNVLTSTNFIKDNSRNALTVTNNGSATWTANGPFNRGSTATAQRQLPDGTLEVYNQFDEFTGAPVVDTSLMVWVDAGQTSSYPGSGATWTDLSGNGKNYTLTNTPTYSSTTNGGVITFAGASSQYATTAAPLFNSTTFNTYTMSLWVYPTGAGNFVQVNGQTTPNTAYHYSAIEISAAGVIKFGQWIGSMSTIATSTQSLNAWYNLIITYNVIAATAYINGVSVGSTNIIWSSPGANTFMALMAIDTTNMGTGAYASGSLGAFMVYRRALSTDEVTTNFNALRGRYGI
jgi:hypothetical protein